METTPNSQNSSLKAETKLSDSAEKLSSKTKVTGIDYHNYVPKHSVHGRVNIRGIGYDHEPGTFR